MRLILKILPVTRSRLGLLVDRNDDGLDVEVAPTFPYSDVAGLCQGIEERRIILGVVVVPRPQRCAPSCNYLLPSDAQTETKSLNLLRRTRKMRYLHKMLRI